MRKIVTIKTIDNVEDVENSDFLSVATIGGWRSVIKRDEYKPGDRVLFLEIDSLLPVGIPEFEFLQKSNQKTVISPITGEEVTGHVLKTVKLRGVISQGLILPIGFGLTVDSTQDEINEAFQKLGVFKWEPPLPTGSGVVGGFPANAQKTDSERVQNLTDEFLQGLDDGEWVATEKIDGTSTTYTLIDGEFICASRNWKVDGENSLQGRVAERLKIQEFMSEGDVIQGEIFGEGINGNKTKISGTRFMVFSWKSSNPTVEFLKFVEENKVPELDLVLPKTVLEAVEQVNGMKSTINPKVQAEGVVWWNREKKNFVELGDRPNFKAINNKFLLKD